MALRDPRTGSPLKNNTTNPGTGMSATGSITLSAGDLILVVYAIRGATTVTISDNLTGSYTALGAAGTGTGRAYGFFRVATGSGTLTSVSTSHSNTTNDAALMVCVFEGPFRDTASVLDKNPTQTNDSTSAYTCPATGTLSQTSELVVGYMAQGNGAASGSYGANNGFTVHADATSGTGSNTVSGAVCYLKVDATTTQTPEFTNATATSGVVSTASFKTTIQDTTFSMSGVATAAFGSGEEIKVSKINSYAVLEYANTSVSKLNTYAVLSPPLLQVSKLNVYAVLTENTATRRRCMSIVKM